MSRTVSIRGHKAVGDFLSLWKGAQSQLSEGVMTDDFKKGVRAAARVAADYNGSTTHDYRLDDCIAAKLNVGRSKPRRNKKRLQNPNDAWTCGVVTALAEMHRKLIGGNDSAGVVETARNCGITVAVAKKAGVSPYDWKELRRAGVP